MSTERELIYLSKKGQRNAQRQLYDLYRTKWYMVCMRYLSNKEDAMDALQNGLINVFGKLNQFDEKLGNFSAWSCRVMVNESLMLIRKTSKFIHNKELRDDLGIIENSETPLDRLSAEELTRIVQKLPDGYRAVFNMYAIEGYTHKEISETLGISIGTSKSQLSKARNVLRKQVEILL